jgi:DNA-binding transcriptional MocR family regulator
MPRPRIVTEDQRRELQRIARARRQLPSDKELARRLKVSTRTVQHIMQELLRVNEVSCETIGVHDPHA